MKPIRVVTFSVAMLASGIVDAMPVPLVSREYQVQITVDTTGHVSSIQPESPLFDNYVRALKQASSTWKFAVPKVDGVPVPCTTWVRVKFVRKRGSEGAFDYGVNYLGNGPYIEFKQIAYPTHLYQWRIAAIFYVHFIVEANGTIDDVQLVQAWTSRGKPIGNAMQDVAKGIMHWTAKPMLVGGHPVSTPMIVPVPFVTSGSLYEDRLDYGLAIASDSPNSGKPTGNIPESGTVAP